MKSKQLLLSISLLEKEIIYKKALYIELEKLYSSNKELFKEKINNPNKNVSSPFIELLFKKDELEHEIPKLEKELIKAKKETTSLINKLNNELYKTILISRYFNKKTWDDICLNIPASKSTIKRYHDRAINSLDSFIISGSWSNDEE